LERSVEFGHKHVQQTNLITCGGNNPCNKKKTHFRVSFSTIGKVEFAPNHREEETNRLHKWKERMGSNCPSFSRTMQEEENGASSEPAPEDFTAAEPAKFGTFYHTKVGGTIINRLRRTRKI
jgi:hypothetical protein